MDVQKGNSILIFLWILNASFIQGVSIRAQSKWRLIRQDSGSMFNPNAFLSGGTSGGMFNPNAMMSGTGQTSTSQYFGSFNPNAVNSGSSGSMFNPQGMMNGGSVATGTAGSSQGMTGTQQTASAQQTNTQTQQSNTQTAGSNSGTFDPNNAGTMANTGNSFGSPSSSSSSSSSSSQLSFGNSNTFNSNTQGSQSSSQTSTFDPNQAISNAGQQSTFDPNVQGSGSSTASGQASKFDPNQVSQQQQQQPSTGGSSQMSSFGQNTGSNSMFNPTQMNNQMSGGSSIMNPNSMLGGGGGGGSSGGSGGTSSSSGLPKYDPNNVINTGAHYDPNTANSATSTGVGTGGNSPSFTNNQGFDAKQQMPGQTSSSSSSGSSQTITQSQSSQPQSPSGQTSSTSGSNNGYDPISTNSLATAGFNPLNPLMGVDMNKYMGPQSSSSGGTGSFNAGAVNMQMANVGTSLNMFGGAGSNSSKMDAGAVMGGGNAIMGGSSSGSSGGSMFNPSAMMGDTSSGAGSSGTGNSGGAMFNPSAMIGGSTGGNPMNMMSTMGGSATGNRNDASSSASSSSGSNSNAVTQTGSAGGSPLDPLGAMSGAAKNMSGGTNLMDPMGFMKGGGLAGTFGNVFDIQKQQGRREVSSFKDKLNLGLLNIFVKSYARNTRATKYNPFDTTGFFTDNDQMGNLGPKIMNFDPNQIMQPDLGLDIMHYDPEKAMGTPNFDPNEVMDQFLQTFNPNKDNYGSQYNPNKIKWIGQNNDREKSTIQPDVHNILGSSSSVSADSDTTINNPLNLHQPYTGHNNSDHDNSQLMNAWTGDTENWANIANSNHQEEKWNEALLHSWKVEDPSSHKDSPDNAWQGEWQKSWPGVPNSHGSIEENVSKESNTNKAHYSGSLTFEETRKALNDLLEALDGK